MTPEPLHVLAAAAMLGVTAALILAFREYLLAGSQRRLSGMLERVGLDPALAASRRRRGATIALRQRCRSCPREDLCERWLRGEEQGGYDFCPNARAFRTLI